jgi:hypothetical protein
MRYVPKEKIYCQTLALTSCLKMAVSINSLGHATYYKRIFQAMKFTPTQLTCLKQFALATPPTSIAFLS